MSRKEIKEKAKQQLGGQIFSSSWLFAVLVIVIVGAIAGIVSWTFVGLIIILGPLSFGISAMFLKQARDNQQMNITDLFNGFKSDFSQTFLLGLMQYIFIWLWSLLFVIPGIVKSYAYSMSYFIKADHPEYTWKQCIDESKAITCGHKWELFVLDLSFIGWAIVGSLVFGVGTLWVSAYMEASRAQAYEVIKGSIVQ